MDCDYLRNGAGDKGDGGESRIHPRAALVDRHLVRSAEHDEDDEGEDDDEDGTEEVLAPQKGLGTERDSARDVDDLLEDDTGIRRAAAAAVLLLNEQFRVLARCRRVRLNLDLRQPNRVDGGEDEADDARGDDQDYQCGVVTNHHLEG